MKENRDRDYSEGVLGYLKDAQINCLKIMQKLTKFEKKKNFIAIKAERKTVWIITFYRLKISKFRFLFQQIEKFSSTDNEDSAIQSDDTHLDKNRYFPICIFLSLII